jgi:hypothetical protein
VLAEGSRVRVRCDCEAVFRVLCGDDSGGKGYGGGWRVCRGCLPSVIELEVVPTLVKHTHFTADVISLEGDRPRVATLLPRRHLEAA